MLNHITIMGRLTRDPELRTTQSGVSVTSFTVAVDRDYTPQGGQKETDFIDCVAWRQGGEFVSKYFHKGSMIVVSGRLESRKWTDRNGQNRTSWEIQVDHSYFGEAKEAADDGLRGPGNAVPGAELPAEHGLRALRRGRGRRGAAVLRRTRWTGSSSRSMTALRLPPRS